jgi:sulfite reductase alpha subunit-like flavoprotein
MGTLTDEGFEYDNGDIAYEPDDEGAIQVRDIDGDSLGIYHMGDDEKWDELAELFGLTVDDFPHCAKCKGTHRVGRHLA